MPRLIADPLPGLPEVRPGDDLAGLLAEAARRLDGGLGDGDVLAVAHKIVSKAEGRVRSLADVAPGSRALALAAEHGKDPRLVELILEESERVVRADAGRLICRTHHGFVCANAGVDQSNAGGVGLAVLLPRDPDGSARALRSALRSRLGAAPAVVITDSFGRAWRQGQAEIALGCAGLAPLDDWRGRPDTAGRAMQATVIAIADQAAAAADLARSKDSREPAVRLRGLERHVTAEDGVGAGALVRAPEQDLFL
jgi:coenzyme F420-0:L-glutamate ligase / coenzyme F420-1:gamma-L-glutamate ligase